MREGEPQRAPQTSGRVVAVVLAAGLSSRMGQPKQLAEVDGEPMVVRAVKAALASTAESVVVVTGAYAQPVTAALASLLQGAGNRLRTIVNPDYAEGQAGSVRAAVRMLGPADGAVLFLPVDQPFLSPKLLNRLIDAWRRGAQLVSPTVDGELRGAPALFDRTLWPELLALEGDVGARPLLQRHRRHLVTVPAPLHELRDIDTPDDLAATA
ncbi:MAG: nucleotidyltransferase family protein [Caldilineaceae bacterium]|nr:nucleotidyltransferase family protein [Caldilineaceae bacterium]